MSQSEISTSLKELKAQCKKLGIKDYGTKKQIFERIKEKEAEISSNSNKGVASSPNDSFKLNMEEEDDEFDLC